MPKVIIKDVPGLDGEYELELVFKHRDFRTIKQVTASPGNPGVRANEVMDAINAGDLDIIVALAEIALQRAGVPHSIEQLWDAEAGKIMLDVSDADVEADASPPQEDDVPRSSSGSATSGNGMSGDTGHSPETSSQAVSGIPRPVDT